MLYCFFNTCITGGEKFQLYLIYHVLSSYPSHHPDHLVFLGDQLSPRTLLPCLCQTPWKSTLTLFYNQAQVTVKSNQPYSKEIYSQVFDSLQGSESCTKGLQHT